MTRVGLVGATGFLGSAIRQALKARGLNPVDVRITRVSGTPSDSLPSAIGAWQRENAAGWASLVEACEGLDAVVNAAGAALPDATTIDAALWSANVLLPAIIHSAAETAGVPRFVHISSAAVQGQGSLDDTEQVDPLSPYAASKAEAERYLLLAASRGGPETVIYRPTSVMGSGRPTTERLAKRLRGRVPVIGDHVELPLALIENVADAAAFLSVVHKPPTIATHPSEGITIGMITHWAGGRTIRLPRAFRGLLRVVMRAAIRLPLGHTGKLRRVDLALFGQTVRAESLEQAGWTPLRGRDYYESLFCPRRPEEPMRVVFLITRSDTVGGAHIHVRDMAKALIDRGYDVHVLVGGNGPYVEILRSRGIPVISVPSLQRPVAPKADSAAYRDLKRLLRRLDPDLLSCHSAKAGVVGRLAGRRLGIPTIFTAHGWTFTDGVGLAQRIFYATVELLLAPLATRIICVSEHDRRLACRVGIDKLTRVQTIPNAVADFRRPSVKSDSESPIITMVARLDDQKCQDEVLKSLAGLRHLRFRVWFVGDGPRESALRLMAHQFCLEDRVEFLGRRDDVEELLAASDVFVLMSNWEGMPRSILEAMRAGLPVVASRTAGVPEMVTPETGVLIPPHDVQTLTRALDTLIETPALRVELGRAARARFLEQFELGRLVEQMINVYSEVLNEHQPRVRCLGPGSVR